MKKVLYFIVAGLCFWFYSCADTNDTSDEDNGGIFGFVTDFFDGEPINNANVQLRPSGTTQQTGANGRFEFLNVKPGSYSITVTKSYYSDLVDPYTIIVKANTASQRDVMIERQPRVLRLLAADGTMNDITGLNFGNTNDVRSFNIFNENPYKLEWTIENNTEWVIVNPLSGTVNPNGGLQPITVTIDRSKKDDDVNSAGISIVPSSNSNPKFPTRDLTISTQIGTAALSLNVNPASGGKVSRLPDSESYTLGTTVTITADAASGYVFTEWTGGAVANQNNASTTITLNSNAALTANFQRQDDIPIGTSLAAQLLALHTNAESDKEYIIELSGNENIGAQPLSFAGRSNITVRIKGVGGERIITLTDKGALFTINSGITLILDNGVTLRGNNSNNVSLIYVNGRGTLIMKTGSKISSNPYRGVYVATDGNFLMEGGEISNNKANGTSYGGGVYVGAGGNFLLENGRISGNTASYGGGVYVYNGLFTATGGEISGNTASYNGGGVYVENGNFIMEGGKISNNKANGTSYGGGGVYVENGNFIMTDGEISVNTARSGGGVFVYGNASIAKTGGIIYGYDIKDNNRNTATAGITSTDKGHAVFVNTNPNKRRETTAGKELNLDSKVTGAAGGWE
ncbi:MAG: carboxypeptidase regulatory-like domain-containing protein [Chitinispirillales bacterium]|jgi:hypothetical protein|nr:carboxypeptidase regulatory-like domain-containing protein [Chitinispirillales bacterium]